MRVLVRDYTIVIVNAQYAAGGTRVRRNGDDDVDRGSTQRNSDRGRRYPYDLHEPAR